MPRYKLFEVYGVELEYMIVDRDSYKVRPIADLLMEDECGHLTGEVDRGKLAWSNELVSHVIELKTNGPVSSLLGLGDDFLEEVEHINQLLESHNAMLLPTGAHPFFVPEKETVIWPHEHNEVYALYDRIFGCTGHGWSNLQSTHLNLPFAEDSEFERLHAAIRALLPIIPGLSASTPLIEGKLTGFYDTRLEYYRKNQQKIPEIAGLIIPEEVFSQAAYEQFIFAPIKKAIAPYDTEGILDKHFLNSRGAIARFDRGAIEIRLIDIQECPRADLAIVEMIVVSLKALIHRFSEDLGTLKSSCSTEHLAQILITASRYGSRARINDMGFLALFDIREPVEIMDIWTKLYKQHKSELSEQAQLVIAKILERGNLSERMFSAISDDPSEAGIRAVYKDLAHCLANNQLYLP